MATTTIYYAKNVLQAIRGLDVQIDQQATLNTILNSDNKSVVPGAAERPILKYLAIGSKGHKLDCANNDILEEARSPSRATLYSHIPWKVLATGSPKPAGYSLKVNKGGKDYYFLKDLPSTGTVIFNEKLVTDLLNPTVFDLTANNIDSTTPPTTAAVTAGANKVITAEHTMTVTITTQEFTDMRAAAASYYGASFKFNTLSELATCTGVENGSGDVVAAQLATILYETISVKNAGEYTTTIDIGTQDPLYTT